MKRLAFLGGLTGLGALALLAVTQRGLAAESLDRSALVAEPMADINDVYTWMDGEQLVLAMTVSPADDGTQAFGPGVQYVFHVHSKADLGVLVPGVGEETRVVCTFQSNASAQCWVTDKDGQVKDYVTGNPSDNAGIKSRSGDVHLYAGRRSDPMFFNLQGFRSAVSAMRALPITRDLAGCPNNLTNAQVQAVTAQLSGVSPVGEPPCVANQRDCFQNLNVQVVLVKVARSLVNKASNATVGVWASTHRGS